MSWTRCRLGHRHWGPHGAAGLLLAREGTALLQLRATWAHRGGTWSVPGGAIERGESALHAALRETEEELGVAGSAVRTAGSRVADCGGGWTYETVLAVPVSSEDDVRVRDLAESAGHAWVPTADVLDLPLHPAFRAAWSDADGVLRDFVAAS